MDRRDFTKFGSMTLLAAACGPALGQDDDDAGEWQDMTPDERREAWEGMSEEERDAVRERMRRRREELRSMTPEEREKLREEYRRRFEALPPEEQEAIRERRRSRQGRGNRKPRNKDQE